jgi:hypothetical protein
VLLDPFKEQFNLPATAIQIGDGYSWQLNLVGQKNQAPALLIIEDHHPSQFFLVSFF